MGKVPHIKKGVKRMVEKFWKSKKVIKRTSDLFMSMVIGNFVYIFAGT